MLFLNVESKYYSSKCFIKRKKNTHFATIKTKLDNELNFNKFKNNIVIKKI